MKDGTILFGGINGYNPSTKWDLEVLQHLNLNFKVIIICTFIITEAAVFSI